MCSRLLVTALSTQCTLRLWKKGAHSHVFNPQEIPAFAISNRFHYYDCLVMPVLSVTNAFPWEKVALLVEYEPLGTGLFPGGQQPASLKPRQWIALKTVQNVSASSLAKSGLYCNDLCGFLFCDATFCM